MFNTPIWRIININILFKSILGSLNLQYVDCMYTYDALINALRYVHIYMCNYVRFLPKSMYMYIHNLHQHLML